jgi:tetratricopeptide (TPR) repeat protein
MTVAIAGRSAGRVSQLWQLPAFIFSLVLFVYAGWLFVNPGPGATVDQKIAVAREYLRQDRPDAAWQQLARILETQKLPNDQEATVHLMLAESLDMEQHQQKENIPSYDQRIIEQTEIAMELGAKPDAATHQRMADSYAVLGHNPEAIDHYRQAIEMDPDHSLSLRRKMIELELAEDDTANADVALDDYLKQPELQDSEKAWALDQRAGVLIDEKEFAKAKSLLADALRLDNDPINQGQFDFQLGYCAYREGQSEEAERYLRLARDLLRTQHPTDADAAFYLGRVFQERGDPVTAISFYEAVLTSHPDAKIAPLALLGRGVCRIMQGQTDAGLMDLHDLTGEIQSRTSRVKFKPDAVAGLQDAEQVLSDRQDYQSTLEVLGEEQTLDPQPPPLFYARLGRVYSDRSDQLESSLPDSTPTERIRRGQQVLDMRTKAGDAYIIYSRDLTLADDKGYADALWKGVDLYDKAGNLQAVISSLELFVAERPDDRLAPDALLRLGQSYQAAGFFDKAIDAYQRNQFRYPTSIAASKSAIPLAQAYIAKGPEYYSKAENTLLGIVENNPLVDPTAEEFRLSLRELAQLYYRTGRYEEAVARLQELTERYPTDDQKPQMVFMMADSYRKSAMLLDDKLTATTQTSGQDMAVAAAARRDRLGNARKLYDQVIDLYHASAPSTDLDREYQKLAYFYRADCEYDLGNYEEAIKLYDAAAFNYQNDPSSVSAYVQIVNAYSALAKPDEAKAANNRAIWMLKHMPAAAFQDGSFSMPKKYWDQWLQWTSKSGMW